jgi:two-component system, OmpR family, sensor histidine kinase KdpD
MRRALTGSMVGIVLAVGLGAALIPVRSHLSVATVALVLVVPVVTGVIIGGFRAGVVSVVAGFLVYDLGFLPPYYRLTVGNPQNWVALGVYTAVMLLVGRVVSGLESARAEAQNSAIESNRLFELSELLVEDRSVDDLLKAIVRAVRTVFDVAGVTLLVPDGDRLAIAATAGDLLSRDELQGLEPLSGVPVRLDTGPMAPESIRTVVLTTAEGPVGILAMRGMEASTEDRAVLRAFANHAALALERARLRDRAVRSELLEEIDRLRHALVGAVSHDLRTPLATMKVASSILLDPPSPLSESDMYELHGLIDLETDRLTRLVTSLLDMTRIEAGVLQLHRTSVAVADLVSDALSALRSALGDRPVAVSIPDSLPDVSVDRVLVGQVLANLVDNAVRHAPAGTMITIVAGPCQGRVALSVTDSGPGVPDAEREAVFNRFVRFDTGGRAGLGLAIAKTFVNAHDEQIWVEDGRDGGARFVFTMPLAASNGSGGS